MDIATKSYNPGFLTDAELRAMFCVRMDAFESLMETLRENTGSSNQHVMVIGTRGSGKTTLLLRVASEIRSDSELSSRLYPITFAEESYGVGTCGEFWLECLSRLVQQVPHRDGEPDLRRTLEDIRQERDDRSLGERCLGALLDFADREDKRLVLGVENLNMLFSDMMDPDAGWCLRKTLQTEPRIMLIGSATSRFGEIDRPDQALYDLFRVLSLRPLDLDESTALCESIAGRSLARGVVRRLQILTGGSPRLLKIMARFAAERSFRTLMADLLDLVDEHTPYFKSHLESLPAQERRVYLALALLWKPATAREVADRARMETSKCSAQLRRLVGRGVVSDEGGTSRRKQYYLTERLYNLYYLLRRSRGADNLVGALVEFMDAYYSRPELEELVDGMVAEAATADDQTRLIYQSAFKRLSNLPELAWHFLEKHPDHVPEEVTKVIVETKVLFDRAGRSFDDGEYTAALEALNRLLADFGSSELAIVQDGVTNTYLNKGIILASLEEHEDAIAAFEHAVERIRSSGKQGAGALLATALHGKATRYDALGRSQDAMGAYDELIQLASSDDSVPELAVADAQFSRGVLLGAKGQHVQALGAYGTVERRFGRSESTPILQTVAKALVNKAGTLARLNRREDAIAVCEVLELRIGDDVNGRLLEPMGRALVIKSTALAVLGRTSEQRRACDQLLELLDRREEWGSQAEVSQSHDGRLLDLRLKGHEIRSVACLGQGDRAVAEHDIRAVLEILPQLDSIEESTIRCLMIGSLELGIEEVASLIRASPSASLLVALTTALELEIGLQPRVAIEIRKVAADIRRDLSKLRAQQPVASGRLTT